MMSRQWLYSFTLFTLLGVVPCLSEAGVTASIGSALDQCLTYEETDGSPSSQACEKLLLSNGSLTDNGNGTFTFSPTGSGTVTSIAQGTNMSFSVDPITTTGTVNLTASPSVTNLTASGTVTGAVVSATSALQVGADYFSDITGSGLSIVGGALTASGGSNHNILSATHSDSVAGAVARGALVYGNVTPAWDKLTVGGSNTVLTANGTDTAWSASPTVTNLTATATVTGLTADFSGQVRSGALTASQYVKSNSGKVLISQATPIPIADGGTGATTLNDLIALTTQTSGNYVASVATTTPLSGGAVGSEGAALTLTIANAAADGATKGAASFDSTDFVASSGNISLGTTPTSVNYSASNTVTGVTADFSGQVRAGSLTANQYVKSNSGSVLVSQTTPIPVADGGTGDATLTSNGVLYGLGTSAIGITAQGSANTVLTANAGVPSFSTSPTVTNLTATNTVTGVTADFSGQVRSGALTASTYVKSNAGKVLISQTTPIPVADGGTGIGTTPFQECHTFENLVAADDNMNFTTANQSMIIKSASCYTTGSFTTQPTLSFQNDAAGAITGAPTCTGTSPPTKAVLSGANATLSAYQTLQFNVTNTPAPTFGTQTIICVVYAWS